MCPFIAGGSHSFGLRHLIRYIYFSLTPFLSLSIESTRNTRTFIHKPKNTKQNKLKCDVIRGNLLYVFCSILSSILLLKSISGILRLIWSMCSKTQTTQLNAGKCYRHSFAKGEFVTRVSAILHSVYWNAGITFDFRAIVAVSLLVVAFA